MNVRFKWWLTAFLTACMSLSTLSAWAAPEKVKWQAQLLPADVRAAESAQIVLTATIEKGWHLYSTTQPAGGSLPTVIQLLPGKALKSSGKVVQPPPLKKFNKIFKITDELYENAVAFGVPVQVTPNLTGPQNAKIRVKFMVCNDKVCLPPATKEIPVTFTPASGPAREDHQAAMSALPPQPPGAINGESSNHVAAAAPPATSTSSTSAPSDDVASRIKTAQSSGLSAFILLAMAMGFLALLTPCVFPMIPITVSFFTKQQEQQGGRGLRGPIAFCLGIIVTFTGIGFLVSVLFGASGVTQFAANPWLNILMALVFVGLALNLFGVFEIMVPPALLDRVQPKRTKGGERSSLLAPVLMGLAFSLTSFTCTVPFVGTLLATTAQGGWYWPLVGMWFFSAAFALPFFLLALFPQWLGKLPKSGGWLVSVKAFMGFLELAAALKFLSTADYVWQLGLLTRPVFLSIWSTIFLIAGFYLLCWLRLPKDSSTATPGTMRRLLGLATIGTGVYLMAAINGAPLGKLTAYPPPPDYGVPENMRRAETTKWKEYENDYDKALAQAKAQNKPMLIDFTGYACTNCREMEANVLSKPEIEKAIEGFIPVRLYTDGPKEFSRRYAKMQDTKFGTVALPLYVILSPDERELGRFEGYDPNPEAFLKFIEGGGKRLAKN